MSIRGVQTARPNSKEMHIGAKYLRLALRDDKITDDERIAVQQCAIWFEQEANRLIDRRNMRQN